MIRVLLMQAPLAGPKLNLGCEQLGGLGDENVLAFAAWERNGEFECTMLQNSALTFLVHSMPYFSLMSRAICTNLHVRESQQLSVFVNLAIYSFSVQCEFEQTRKKFTPEMKLQCEVCEKAEAEVLCCSDEAVLCKSCDEKVHATNKLFQRHNRVALLKHSSTSSGAPLCDICQERKGYFLCLEDRAMFCKNCDDAIHARTSHQRFLVSGVQVSLQSYTENTECSTSLSSASYQIYPNASLNGLFTSGESEAGNSGVNLEKERHEGNR